MKLTDDSEPGKDGDHACIQALLLPPDEDKETTDVFLRVLQMHSDLLYSCGFSRPQAEDLYTQTKRQVVNLEGDDPDDDEDDDRFVCEASQTLLAVLVAAAHRGVEPSEIIGHALDRINQELIEKNICQNMITQFSVQEGYVDADDDDDDDDDDTHEPNYTIPPCPSNN